MDIDIKESVIINTNLMDTFNNDTCDIIQLVTIKFNKLLLTITATIGPLIVNINGVLIVEHADQQLFNE